MIGAIPALIRAGSAFAIAGSNFTRGSMVNFFVSTASGPLNAGPLAPAAASADLLEVEVPAATALGQGFVAVQVVNTDRKFVSSNLAYALLQGTAAAGIPSLTSINGKGLAATSADPRFAVNNVETVIAQGSVVTLGGAGFDTANGIAVDLFCACPGGKAGPFFLRPAMATSVSFVLPAAGASAPATGPGSFVISNRGADGKYARKSNAVSVAVGAEISVRAVSQGGTVITVDGSGFSAATVINLFNTQAGGVVNLGGLTPGGAAAIPITLINPTRLTFTRPRAAVPGASYVQALNPPFVPFASSGDDPGGSFVLK